MLLYASDSVIKLMGEFVRNPNEENYWRTGLEMRKDLYGMKSKLKTSDLLIPERNYK